MLALWTVQPSMLPLVRLPWVKILVSRGFRASVAHARRILLRQHLHLLLNAELTGIVPSPHQHVRMLWALHPVVHAQELLPIVVSLQVSVSIVICSARQIKNVG